MFPLKNLARKGLSMMYHVLWERNHQGAVNAWGMYR